MFNRPSRLLRHLESSIHRPKKKSPSISDVFPEVRKYWHSSNRLGPEYMSPFSTKKFTFKCDKGHVYDRPASTFMQTVERKGHPGCSVCVNKIVIPERSVASTHPEIVAIWDSSNTIQPTQVSSSSDRIIKFRFPCGHTTKTSVHNRVHFGLDRCPICVSKHDLPSYYGKRKSMIIENLIEYMTKNRSIPVVSDWKIRPYYQATRLHHPKWEGISSWWDMLDHCVKTILERDKRLGEELLDKLEKRRERYEIKK